VGNDVNGNRKNNERKLKTEWFKKNIKEAKQK